MVASTRTDVRLEAVIKLPTSSSLLSFQNLVEAHVLGAIRRQHGVSLQRVRKALRFVQRKIQQPHPLITVEFQTDGVDLFVKESSGRLINASGAGQTEIDEAIRKSLARIDRDEEGVASRLFPFVRGTEGEPKVIFDGPQALVREARHRRDGHPRQRHRWPVPGGRRSERRSPATTASPRTM